MIKKKNTNKKKNLPMSQTTSRLSFCISVLGVTNKSFSAADIS